jgi:hypothetical protein
MRDSWYEGDEAGDYFLVDRLPKRSAARRFTTRTRAIAAKIWRAARPQGDTLNRCEGRL